MSELDVEALKQLARRIREGFSLAGQESIATGDPSLLPLPQLAAIIAALVDYDRLRAAAQFLVEDRHGLAPWALDYLRAALEGHDG